MSDEAKEGTGIFLTHAEAQVILDYITIGSTPAPQPGCNGVVYMMIESIKRAPSGQPVESKDNGSIDQSKTDGNGSAARVIDNA